MSTAPKADPAIHLAEVADRLGMYARDVIRFPELVKKYKVRKAELHDYVAHAADDINREAIDKLLRRYAVRPAEVWKEEPEKEVTHRPRYDWDMILSGEIVQLEQGVDFQCKCSTFASLVKQTASKRDQNVRVAVQDETVIVQASKGLWD